MKVFHYLDVEGKAVEEEEAKGVTVRWLITKEMGAKNFAMRLFEVEADGYTPLHSHPWEHEVFVLEGEGEVYSEDGVRKIMSGDVVFIPPNEKHQFKNGGKGKLKFICLIPYLDSPK